MKKSIEIAQKIVEYFSTAKIIGSAIMLRHGYLQESDINDIDVGITDVKPETGSEFFRVQKFLNDLGFIETSAFPSNTGPYGGFSQGSSVFKNPEYDLPIHVVIHDQSFKVWSIDNIVGAKFQRGSASDLYQVGTAASAKKLLIQDGEDTEQGDH